MVVKFAPTQGVYTESSSMRWVGRVMVGVVNAGDEFRIGAFESFFVFHESVIGVE